MELAEKGLISTLIVKDHSRLGRNRLIVGQLLEEGFDNLGVRYIAIMDNIDTAKGISQIVPMQDLFNEWHAQNTSQKVRNVFKKQGNVRRTADHQSAFRLPQRPGGQKQLDCRRRRRENRSANLCLVCRRIGSHADRKTLESRQSADTDRALAQHRQKLQQAACRSVQLVFGYRGGYSQQAGILR